MKTIFFIAHGVLQSLLLFTIIIIIIIIIII